MIQVVTLCQNIYFSNIKNAYVSVTITVPQATQNIQIT
jgi:hypothetical protein